MNELEQKKEIIREELKKLAEKLGKTPTQKDCKKEKQLKYSYHQIIYIYGTWNEALKDADIEPNPIQCPPHNEYSDKELVDNFIEVANRIGKIPSGNVFSANTTTISIRPYTRKFGCWTNAIAYITQNYSTSFNFSVNDSVDSNNKHQKGTCHNRNIPDDSINKELQNYQESKINYIQPDKVKINHRNKKTVYGAHLRSLVNDFNFIKVGFFYSFSKIILNL